MSQFVSIPGVGKVEFPSSMSDADIEEAIKTKILPTYAPGAVTEFGRSAASLADTALNAVTGTLDWAAYPLARAWLGDAQQAREQTTSPKDMIGRAFGITDTPQYQNEASRRATQAIGQALQENVTAPLARASNIPESDIENMLGTLGLAGGVATAPAVRRIGREQIAPRVMAAEEAIRAAPGQAARAVAKPFKSAGEGLAAGMRGGEPRFSRPVSEELITQGREGGALSGLDEFLLRSAANRGEAGRAPVKGEATASMFEDIMREALGTKSRTALGTQGALDLAGILGLGIPMQGTLGRGALQGLRSGLSPKISNIDDATILGSRSGSVGQKPGEARTRSVDDLLNELDKMRTESSQPRPVPPTGSAGQQSQATPRPVPPGGVMSMMVDDSQPSRSHGSKQQPLTSQQAEQYRTFYELSEDPYSIVSRSEDGLLRRDFRQDDGVKGHMRETADGGRVSDITYPSGQREKQVLNADKSKTTYTADLDTLDGKEFVIETFDKNGKLVNEFRQYFATNDLEPGERVPVILDKTVFDKNGRAIDRIRWRDGETDHTKPKWPFPGTLQDLYSPKSSAPYPSEFGDWQQPIWDTEK